MTQQQFNEILGRVHTLHTDFEDGISDEQAYDMALFILDDNPNTNGSPNPIQSKLMI